MSGSKAPKYAVSRGRETGIFDRYKDQVHPSTNRYPGNIYQKFPSQDAAERALDTSKPYPNDDGPQYAVKNGRNLGIYDDWLRAAPEVLGYPHNEHRKFNDRSTAEKWMRDEPTEKSAPSDRSYLDLQTSRYHGYDEPETEYDHHESCGTDYGTNNHEDDYGDYDADECDGDGCGGNENFDPCDADHDSSNAEDYNDGTHGGDDDYDYYGGDYDDNGGDYEDDGDDYDDDDHDNDYDDNDSD